MMHLQELGQIVEERDEARLIPLLKSMIPDYTPSAQLLKAALPRKLEPRWRCRG